MPSALDILNKPKKASALSILNKPSGGRSSSTFSSQQFSEVRDIVSPQIPAELQPVNFADFDRTQPTDATRVDPSFADADRRPVLQAAREDLKAFTGQPPLPYRPTVPAKFKGDFGMDVSFKQPLTPNEQRYVDQNPLEQAGSAALQMFGGYGLGAVEFATDLPGKVISPGEHIPEDEGSYLGNLLEVIKQEGTGLRQMGGDFIPTMDYLIRKGIFQNPDPSADIEPLSPLTKLAELISGEPMTQENYQAAINRFYEAPETPLFAAHIATGLGKGGLKAGKAIAGKVGRKFRAQPLEHRGFTQKPPLEPGTKRIGVDYQTEGLRPIEGVTKRPSTIPEPTPVERLAPKQIVESEKSKATEKGLEEVSRETPESVAEAAGVKITGFQEGPKGKKQFINIHDPVTGGDYLVKGASEISSKVKAKRAEFEAGKVPKTKVEAGTEAVEVLKKSQIKPPPPETPTIGGALIPSEVVTKAAEATRKAMTTITTATSEIIAKAKTPLVVKEGVKQAKEAMIEHDRQIRRAESTAALFKKIVEDAVPSSEKGGSFKQYIKKSVHFPEKAKAKINSRQMLMLHAFEQGKGSKYWRQLNGTERNLLEWALKEKRKLDRYIDKHKVLDRLEMPEGMNHISHWWNDPKTGKPFAFKYGKLSKTTPLAKQRTVATFEEGINKGLIPATTNLGEIIGQSWESVVRAQQSREMFKTLYTIAASTEGTIQLSKGSKLKPLRMVESWNKLTKQGLTEGYERYSHEALDRAMTFKTGDGTLVRLKGAVGVHKDLYPFVKAYLESPTYTKLDQLNFATKSLKLGASLFHVVSLGAQELANFRVPFVNIKRGLELRKNLDPTVRLLHQEGLEILKGYEDLGYRNSFFEGATLGGKAGNVATLPITMMRDFIFNVVQPGMKTSFAVDMYNKLLPKYLEKGLTKEQLARDVVKKADGHFSGEHYKRALLETNSFMVRAYFDPGMRRWWQRVLLSPTWQREHLLVAKNVAKSFMTDKMIRRLKLEDIGPIKSQYRRYALGAIMMIGAADLYNYMTTLEMDGKGRHLWENPKGKHFAVRARWEEPDYTVTDKNGKERTIRGGPAYIRPLKSVFEIAEWTQKPFAKFSYKLSPGMSALIAQFPVGSGFGSRYEGWDLPDRTKDFVFDVTTPITLNQFLDWQKGKRSGWGAVLPFFGMPTSKVKRKPKKAR